MWGLRNIIQGNGQEKLRESRNEIRVTSGENSYGEL